MSLAFNNHDSQFAVNEQLVIVNKSVTSRDQILTALAELLYKGAYVKDSFCNEIIKREGQFPTGLHTSSVGIAIPHTDNAFVLRPAIAIATLSEPVSFRVMASPDEIVPVKIIIMLAIHKPEAQLQMLQKVIEMIQNKDALLSLSQASTKLEVVNITQKHLVTQGGDK